MKLIIFLLRISSILFVYMPISLIHSSADRHLVCFHILAIMNSANNEIQYLSDNSFILGTVETVGLVYQNLIYIWDIIIFFTIRNNAIIKITV